MAVALCSIAPLLMASACSGDIDFGSTPDAVESDWSPAVILKVGETGETSMATFTVLKDARQWGDSDDRLWAWPIKACLKVGQNPTPLVANRWHTVDTAGAISEARADLQGSGVPEPF
jgi:hypothetical protein